MPGFIIGNGLFLGSGGVGGGAVAAVGTSASRYSVAGTGLRWPTTSSSVTNIYHVLEFRFGTPDYPTTDPMFFCPSFWCPTSPGEVFIANGESITVQGISIETATNVWTTCDGAADAGIFTVTNASAGAWTPRVAATLAANTMYRARIAFFVSNTGVSFPRNSSLAGASAPAGQEKGEGSATSRFSRIQSTGSNLSNSGGLAYKPAAMVAKGGDGRPAVITMGDSIGYGDTMSGASASWTSRNEFGYVAIGLDSNNSAKRLAYHIMCSPGQSATQWNTPLNWAGRRAAFQSIYDLQGAYPFDEIISQHITNGASGNGSIRSVMEPYFDMITGHFGKPITQIEAIQKNTSTDGYTTVGNQTGQNGAVYPNGNLWTFNADVGGADGLGDPTAYYRVQGKIIGSIAPWRLMAADLASNRDKCAVRSFSTTLAAGFTTGGTSVSLTAAPTVGMILSLRADSSTWSNLRSVTAVTGTGPYTATLDGSLTGSASAGNPVQESWGEGLHPSGILHRDVLSGALTAWKSTRGWV